MSDDYLEKNRHGWNLRTDIHLKSKFYDVEAFKQGKSSLNEIKCAILGDVRGKRILHLQCHFGQDSLSLSRLGAQVTGVDLSDRAIDAARQLNDELGLDAEFICCDLYALEEHLERSFDWIFTSYGTIGWLPDLDSWARIISRFLEPGGRFLLVEFHPVVWMWDDAFTKLTYPYFNRSSIVETNTTTYTDGEATASFESTCWNHPLSEVVTSLLSNGLEITRLEEFDYSPYDCFEKTVKVGERKFRIEPFGDGVPLVYAMEARKSSVPG